MQGTGAGYGHYERVKGTESHVANAMRHYAAPHPLHTPLLSRPIYATLPPQQRSIVMKIKSLSKQPFHEYGFWWWWDPKRNDWFVSCAPSVGIPTWAG